MTTTINFLIFCVYCGQPLYPEKAAWVAKEDLSTYALFQSWCNKQATNLSSLLYMPTVRKLYKLRFNDLLQAYLPVNKRKNVHLTLLKLSFNYPTTHTMSIVQKPSRLYTLAIPKTVQTASSQYRLKPFAQNMFAHN
jgi:hypothetical protein